VERRFIGLNNGILDQSVNILSEKDKLTVVDCNTLEYRIIPKPKNMPEFEIVIVYSGISKSLISTDYNNRVDECKVAAWLLQELAHQELASSPKRFLTMLMNQPIRHCVLNSQAGSADAPTISLVRCSELELVSKPGRKAT